MSDERIDNMSESPVDVYPYEWAASCRVCGAQVIYDDEEWVREWAAKHTH